MIFKDKEIVSLCKVIQFFITIKDRYTLKVIGTISIDECYTNTHTSDLFNKIFNIALTDEYAFTISGKMDGKVALNRHIVFDIKVNEYNLTLDANIVLSEYADRKMEFIKLFNKVNSIRMLDGTAFDDTGFEFTNTYARIKLRDSE